MHTRVVARRMRKNSDYPSLVNLFLQSVAQDYVSGFHYLEAT